MWNILEVFGWLDFRFRLILMLSFLVPRGTLIIFIRTVGDRSAGWSAKRTYPHFFFPSGNRTHIWCWLSSQSIPLRCLGTDLTRQICIQIVSSRKRLFIKRLSFVRILFCHDSSVYRVVPLFSVIRFAHSITIYRFAQIARLLKATRFYFRPIICL